MKITEVTKRENDLICLYNDAKEANKQLSEAIQSVVRRYIAALASEKTNTVVKEAEQLVMLFTALSTVQGQVAA